MQRSEARRSADTQFWHGGWRGRDSSWTEPPVTSSLCVHSGWVLLDHRIHITVTILLQMAFVKAQKESNCLGFSLQKWSIWDLPGQRSALKSPHLVRLALHWMFNTKNYLANIKLSLLFPEKRTKHKFLEEFKQSFFPLLLLFWSVGFFPIWYELSIHQKDLFFILGYKNGKGTLK